MADAIHVENARVHNLKGISLDIPRNQVVAFTGVSGSGKSSLVFDTLHTEAQRQLIETFSSFSRRYLPKLSRPDVDEIRNLSTSIVIDQKRLGRTLRSTVGTATEVYTYLRMLSLGRPDTRGYRSPSRPHRRRPVPGQRGHDSTGAEQRPCDPRSRPAGGRGRRAPRPPRSIAGVQA